MKAIRVHEIGGPEVLKLEDVPDPVPGPGQVLVRIKAIGVNPVDTYIRSAAQGRKPTLPYTPGSDAAGLVDAVGPGVTSVSPGQRVYTGGTSAGAMVGSYAELAVCDLTQVHPLPDSVSFSQGAAINVPYATAYRALFQRAHARPAETVLVHGGSGGVGTAAIQLARAHGMNVIATAGTDRGMALIREQGAHHAVNHREANYLERISSLTGGRGVDLILEMLANVNLDRDLGLLALRGRVVVIGNRGRVEIDARQAMSKDAAILGMMMPIAPADELASLHAALVAGLEAGTLKPVIGQELPLAQAARAHEAVMEPGAYGKIVLVP